MSELEKLNSLPEDYLSQRYDDSIAAAAESPYDTIPLYLEKEALEKAKKELEEKLYTDGPTGLPNRAAFNEDIKTLDIKKDTNPPYIFYFDLNLLKQTNDQYGHEAGDRLIKKMAYLLKSVFPDFDGKAYRDTNGDEFLGVMTGDNYEAVLQKLNEKCQTINVISKTKGESRLSYAVGYAQFDRNQKDKNLFDTKNRADINMRKNKKIMQQNDPSLKRD